jgi:hypothetical protein
LLFFLSTLTINSSSAQGFTDSPLFCPFYFSNPNNLNSSQLIKFVSLSERLVLKKDRLTSGSEPMEQQSLYQINSTYTDTC